MAAFMRSVFSKKIGGVFSSFKAVELLRNNTPTVLRLGIIIRWSHCHQRLPVHQTLYCSTQKFPFTCTSFYQPCLHSSAHQACLQPLSILTSHETSDSSTSSNQESTEEMENLYKSVELKVKGHDDAVLNSYQKFVFMAAKELNITVQRVSRPIKKISWLTVLKSRHIYKKHRVQYEMRTYFRIIKLIHLTGSTADVFVEYIERNLPEGVALQVTKCALEKMPDHLQAPPEGSVMPSSSSSTASELSSSSSEDEDERPKEIKD